MGLIGYVLAAGSPLLLLPLLSVIAVLWVFDGLRGGDRAGRMVRRIGSRQSAANPPMPGS
jgi:hypothetical protein